MLLLVLSTITNTAYGQKRGKASKAKAQNDSILIRNKRMNAAMFSDALKEKTEGNYTAAKQKFELALQFWPDDAASMYELADIDSKTAHLDEAIRLMNNATALEPNNKWYLEKKAQLFRLTGDLKSFAKTYRDLLNLEPDNIEYIGELSTALLLMDETNEAVKLLDEIEKQIGTNEMLSMQKQSIFLNQGKPEKAIAEIKKLVDAFPAETRYMMLLADLYKKTGQTEQALALYEKMAENEADDPYANIALAEQYRDLGRDDEAFSALLKAFESPKMAADNKLHILQLWFQGRENDETISESVQKAAQVLVRVHPDSPEGYQLLANYQLHHGQYEEARKNLLIHYDKEKQYYETGEALLFTDFYLKDFESLVKHAAEVISTFPEQPVPYFLSGIAFFQLKQYEEALKNFESGKRFVVANNTLLVDFYSQIGNTQKELKNYQASDSAFDKALSIDGNNATILNNYAYYLSLRNESLDKAKEMSYKSVQLDPENSSYLDTYAWVLFKKGEYAEALSWIEKAIEKSIPESGTIVEHYGDILFHLGRVDEALAQWKQAAELGSASDQINKKIKTANYVE